MALPTRDDLEKRISGLTPEEQNWARSEFERRLRETRAEAVRGVAAEESAAQAASPLRRVAGTGFALGMNAVNSALLGYLPNVVGAVGGDAEAVGTALAASQQTNPGAAFVGSLGGMFGGPAGALAKAAGTAAATATGATRLAKATVASPFAARAGAQILQNMAGGAGAITAQRLVEQTDEDASLGARLSRAAAQVTSPSNLALSAGVGALTARYTKPLDAEIRAVAEKYERITGKKLPADVLSNSEGLQRAYDMLARAPGTSGDVRNVRERLFAGLRQMVASLGDDAVGGANANRSAVASKGATAVRGLGDKIAGKRLGDEAAALAAEGGNRLTRAQQSDLLADVGKALAQDKRGVPRADLKADPRGADMTTLLRDLREVAKAGPLSVRNLEAFRARLGSEGWALAGNPRAAAEARDLYWVIDKAIGHAGPGYQASLRQAEKLRRMEESLQGVKVSELADDVLAQFWQGRGAMERWGALQKFGTLEDQGAVKGWLFHSLIERVVDPKTGMVSAAKLDQATRAPRSPFNAQILDRVLPGVRRELAAYATIATRARQGVAAAEGSQTAGRAARLASYYGAPAAIVATVAGLFANPFATAATVLGGSGVGWVLHRSGRSLIDGLAAQQLQSLFSGEAPRAMTKIPAALAAMGGATGVATGATGLPVEAAQLGAAGAQAVMGQPAAQ